MKMFSAILLISIFLSQNISAADRVLKEETAIYTRYIKYNIICTKYISGPKAGYFEYQVMSNGECVLADYSEEKYAELEALFEKQNKEKENEKS